MRRKQDRPVHVSILAMMLSFLCVCAVVSVKPISAGAQHTSSKEVTAQIIGGGYYPSAAGGRVAFIATENYTCSGVLVGEREVLTAAHCVVGAPSTASYNVYVGGAWRSVESAWYSSRYDPSQSPVRMARFDLGMLVLTESVSGTSPMPVLRRRKISPGATIFIAGYGANERSDQPNRTFVDDFKIGAARVEKVRGGVIAGDHRVYRASPCAGDSGGPATFLYKDKALAVAGVLSAGTNKVLDSRCRLRYKGAFMYVDLQSAASRAFLSYFAGVRYATR